MSLANFELEGVVLPTAQSRYEKDLLVRDNLKREKSSLRNRISRRRACGRHVLRLLDAEEQLEKLNKRIQDFEESM